MNAQGPELRDIHLPADPSWWPPAPGWWLLALLVAGAITWLAVLVHRRSRRRRRIGRVMAELDGIAARQRREPDDIRLLGEISQLLRRASRLVDPAAASLRGEAWLGFLDRHAGVEDFSNGVGRNLLEGPYRRNASVDGEALLGLARRWMMRVLSEGAHRV